MNLFIFQLPAYGLFFSFYYNILGCSLRDVRNKEDDDIEAEPTPYFPRDECSELAGLGGVRLR